MKLRHTDFKRNNTVRSDYVQYVGTGITYLEIFIVGIDSHHFWSSWNLTSMLLKEGVLRLHGECRCLWHAEVPTLLAQPTQLW